eukprot:s584_g14.t1
MHLNVLPLGAKVQYHTRIWDRVASKIGQNWIKGAHPDVSHKEEVAAVKIKGVALGCGRRGTHGTGLALVAALVAAGDISLRFVWQVWHSRHWAGLVSPSGNTFLGAFWVLGLAAFASRRGEHRTRNGLTFVLESDAHQDNAFNQARLSELAHAVQSRQSSCLSREAARRNPAAPLKRARLKSCQ